MEKNFFKLDSNSNLSNVKEGGVIFATNVHTAIVVGIVRSGSNVVSIDVVIRILLVEMGMRSLRDAMSG